MSGTTHHDEPCPTCDGLGGQHLCARCRGEGWAGCDHLDPCPDCKGTGKYVTGSWPLGMTARMADAPCPSCDGAGDVAVNFGIDADGPPDIIPCPDCDSTGTAAAPVVVTDGMIETAWLAYLMAARRSTQKDGVTAALTAALAAAPAVEGWVWCEEYGTPSRGPHAAKLVRIGACPGPHRMLLLGPEVDA